MDYFVLPSDVTVSSSSAYRFLKHFFFLKKKYDSIKISNDGLKLFLVNFLGALSAGMPESWELMCRAH